MLNINVSHIYIFCIGFTKVFFGPHVSRNVTVHLNWETGWKSDTPTNCPWALKKNKSLFRTPFSFRCRFQTNTCKEVIHHGLIIKGQCCGRERGAPSLKAFYWGGSPKVKSVSQRWRIDSGMEPTTSQKKTRGTRKTGEQRDYRGTAPSGKNTSQQRHWATGDKLLSL